VRTPSCISGIVSVAFLYCPVCGYLVSVGDLNGTSTKGLFFAGFCGLFGFWFFIGCCFVWFGLGVVCCCCLVGVLVLWGVFCLVFFGWCCWFVCLFCGFLFFLCFFGWVLWFWFFCFLWCVGCCLCVVVVGVVFFCLLFLFLGFLVGMLFVYWCCVCGLCFFGGCWLVGVLVFWCVGCGVLVVFGLFVGCGGGFVFVLVVWGVRLLCLLCLVLNLFLVCFGVLAFFFVVGFCFVLCVVLVVCLGVCVFFGVCFGVGCVFFWGGFFLLLFCCCWVGFCCVGAVYTPKDQYETMDTTPTTQLPPTKTSIIALLTSRLAPPPSPLFAARIPPNSLRS